MANDHDSHRHIPSFIRLRAKYYYIGGWNKGPDHLESTILKNKILLVIYSLLFWKIVDCLLVTCQTTGIDNQGLSKYVIIVLYIIDTTIDENNLQQIDLL